MIQIFVLIYLAIFVTGFWLSRKGRPFSVALLTAHKLVSLAAVVLLGFVVYRVTWEAALRAVDWIAVAVTGLFTLGTIATGGLLSAGEPKSAAVLWAHRITPFLAVLSTAATLYLLLSPKV
jgi:hypothetical protein